VRIMTPALAAAPVFPIVSTLAMMEQSPVIAL
jgi:hypothetical protein